MRPFLLILLATTSVYAAEPTLPGTEQLTVERPIDELMVEGINRFCLRELAQARDGRRAKWQQDFTNVAAYTASIRPNRNRLREIIGAVDPRMTATMNGHDFELITTLGNSSIVARADEVTVHQVRWQVLPGVSAEGLLLKPARVRAAVIALPDADWTPEMLCGIGDSIASECRPFARVLAEAGCLVAIPTLISRDDEFSGHPHVGFTNQPHREFIYRQAFEMGRHPIGFEAQKVLAAVDLFTQLDASLPIGVAGVSEGGLIALYAAAIDERIDTALVSGYFREREGIWREPVYRNVWRLLAEFGDAELAGLVAPRRLVIEACRVPEVKGPPTAKPGRRVAAAPGRIEICPLESVVTEHARVTDVYQQLKREGELVLAVSGADGRGPAGSRSAVAAFAAKLGVEPAPVARLEPWEIVRIPSAANRQRRQFDEMQEFVQDLLRRCHKTRNAKWRADLSSVDSWLPTRDRLRAMVHDELIGRLQLPHLPPNPRTRLVLDTDEYRGYEVVLDVAADIIASGILLLPRDLKADEQRPVIVCQHGLEGVAMDTISREPSAFRYYKAFAEELCRRGYIVYAPQNPYRGKDRFRSIQRKANPLGLSLFSFIIEQHRQTLDWIATLPNVDSERIAFYGLSYGGKTAMRVPPFLVRYCLSICSADFTDWANAIATNEEPYGYLFTSEYEIPEWNLGHVASYAELAMLMSPRPFMVEAGHRDGGQLTESVAAEFGKVRRHYDQLGIGDRAEVEFFDGPHTINGRGTFRFLDRHLMGQRER